MADIRTEALLNEYKGNLYEFLVAREFARNFNQELFFLKSIKPDFQKMLAQQEQLIREYYPHLLTDLPLLAKSLVEKLAKELQIKSIDKIQIMGKAGMAASDDRFSEADILVFSGKQVFPISIKICKSNSYVNTKSAGLKSFFSKYLDSPDQQKILNDQIDSILDLQLYELYEENGLEIDQSYENWICAGLPSLPGQLERRSRSIYLSSLYKLNKIIFQYMKEILEDRPRQFLKGMYSLIGFSSFEVSQATTFYQNISSKYVLDHHSVECINNEKYQLKDIKLGQLDKNKTSFDILFPDRILQIRIKAMNKFTSKSYKLNCSVKKLK